MDPEQATEAAEDAAATGGFEDDLEVETPDEPTEDDEVEVPEGARDPEAVERLIKAERKRAKDANARARELEAKLREQRDAAPQESAEQTQAREAAESRALRLEVALDKGLSKTLALRLQGTTREELEADAEALLSEVGTRTAGRGMEGGYKQDPPAPVQPPEKAHNAMLVEVLRGAHRQQ